MKKHSTFLLTLILFVSVNGLILAQNVPIDFEAGGNGANWTWTVFENDTNPALEIIPNPDASGINTSATVAKFTALQSGQPFAGVESLHGAGIGTFTLDSSNCTVKIMVWKPVISDVGIKFALPDGGALPEIKVANTLINQWEELTFDFSGRIGQPVTIGQDQIIIFPDFDLAGRTQDNICYFDNITFSEISQAPQPTVAAPTPTVPSENVISLFSNAYTDVPVDTWLTIWSSALLADIQIQANDTKLYTELDFAGIETVANPIDATDMDFFNIDVWSPNATTFRVKLVDLGASVEGELAFNIAQEEWVSLQIPLDNFADPALVTDPAKLLTVRNSLQQYIISGLPAGAVTAYVDNVYLSTIVTDVKEVSSSIPSTYTLEQNYPNPFNPTTKISFSILESNNVTLKVYNMLGEKVATLVNGFLNAGTFEVAFDATNLPTGTYIYSITAGNFNSVKKMMLIK